MCQLSLANGTLFISTRRRRSTAVTSSFANAKKSTHLRNGGSQGQTHTWNYRAYRLQQNAYIDMTGRDDPTVGGVKNYMPHLCRSAAVALSFLTRFLLGRLSERWPLDGKYCAYRTSIEPWRRPV